MTLRTAEARTILDRTGFIRANTAVLAVPLVPEIRLHLAHEAVPLWQKTEEEMGEMGVPPPFWAFAWAGGQALARYVLDHPETVRGRHVLDLAAGSGLVGISAALAGAETVTAADIDAFSIEAVRLNAEINGVAVAATAADLLRSAPVGYGTVLVGDVFYEAALARMVLAWLEAVREAGGKVLIGDPGRSYLPKHRLERVAEYQVPITRELEDSDIKRTAVWRLN